ncbi:histone H1-like repetitive region-containing protein [Desulfosarcina ovata]|nr:histone H1-like repetitive region-containing protein [Desulfosarcina ovata]
MSVPELLKKQFDRETPEVLYRVPETMVEPSVFAAPELLAGMNAEDAKRVKGLLANTYSEKDLKEAAEKAAQKPAPKAKPVSRAELIKKQFDVVAPEVLYCVPEAMVEPSVFAAPELLAGMNAEDAKRIKGLLANTYNEADLKAAAEKAAAEKAAAEKAAAEKAAAEKAAAEKAAAEKAAAEKAAAEKAAAEKAAAEKAAAEKAAAEKAAAEKAAAEKAAAEKAAAEKAAAEKAAAEKAAAEKAAAEKAAAEKAAAEKAAAEKAAAEKAAAEKAAAEKAAAEKAAAEKAAAEKAAAEKAAAEKAAAEKAAAEKAAAEKAAAEKAAAEKAAAEKAAAIKLAAAQKSEVEVSYDTESAQPKKKDKKPSDPVDITIMLIAAGLAFLIFLIVGASISNSTKYYLKEKYGALEIWKGNFAPLGEKRIAVLPGVAAPEAANVIYRAKDVYPLAYGYFIDKADALLDVSGIPDVDGIKTALKKALEFAETSDMRNAAFDRLDTIDRITLSYRADIAASRGTVEGLAAAVELLNDAANLTTDKMQKEMIAQRIATHEAALISLEEQAAAEQVDAETEAAPADETVESETPAAEPEASEAAPESDAETH